MSYSFREITAQLKVSAIYDTLQIPLKFIVDAQLPYKLSAFLKDKGFDAIHTLGLPDKNATTDKYIKKISQDENRILVTKDDDFLRSFLIEKKPSKLILVKTGNITNKALMEIFAEGLPVITQIIQAHTMLEITKEEIIAHH